VVQGVYVELVPNKIFVLLGRSARIGLFQFYHKLIYGVFGLWSHSMLHEVVHLLGTFGIRRSSKTGFNSISGV
jgi:hypothetical protein